MTSIQVATEWASTRVLVDLACRYLAANPECLAHRITPLLARVTWIEFDIWPTEEAALNRQEQLICVLNPRALTALAKSGSGDTNQAAIIHRNGFPKHGE